VPRDTLEQLLQQGFDHFSAGRFSQADGFYRKILDRDPLNHEAIHMAAVISHATGQTDRAAMLFARAIELAPNAGHYHHNAGKFFAEQDKHDSALVYLRRAVALIPNDPRIYANLAHSLRTTGKLDFAETAARTGLTIQEKHPGCLAQLGNILREMGRIPEAVDALKHSVAGRPLAAIHDNLIFALFNDPTLTPAGMMEHHRIYARLYADQFAQHIQPHTNIDRAPDRRLRIAYLSADFRHHPVAAFMDGAFRNHDLTQFDVTCYAANLQEDDVTRQIKTYPLRYVDVRFDNFDQLDQRIRRDQIDILIDLSGHTAHNRLLNLAVKPAPIQISYLGDPGTTGFPQVDYRISDPIVDPPGLTESFYTESLLRLPGGFSCYTPDTKSHPDVSPLPALENGYVTFGSLHALAKINDQVIDLWSIVLNSIPNSRLLMLRHTLTDSTLQRYTQAFISRGIDPSRLQFRHQPLGPTHLHTYRHIDCCLDTFPFSGHTTSCEALYNGVPTLTLNLPTLPPHSRMVSSILTQAGLPDFIATSPEDFLSRAIAISSDLPKLSALREKLRQQMLSSPLCNAPTFTRELESAYRTAWHRFCATP
jgi:predicted O-linked N-acetylglucosamine transferase (SPINDLY family)